MADGRSRPCQTHHLVGVEVNAVGKPRPLAEPSAIVEVVERPAAIDFLAIAVLILGFGEVSVQSHFLLRGQLRRQAHQRGCDGKRRTRRKRNLYHRVLAALVIALDQPLAVGEDRILILDNAVRRKPAVAMRQVHRAARQHHSDAEPLRRSNLDVNRLGQPLWEHIMMVGARGAAGEKKLGHRHGRRKVQRFRGQPRPNRIERLEPGKQLAIQGRWSGSRKRLVEMMMGIDQARHHNMVARLEDRGVRRDRYASGRHKLHDAAFPYHYAAFGFIGKNGQGILDPECSLVVQPLSFRWSKLLRPLDWRNFTRQRFHWNTVTVDELMDLNTITALVRPRRRDDVPRWKDGDAWLAGGTWLFSEPPPCLRRLIDLAKMEPASPIFSSVCL